MGIIKKRIIKYSLLTFFGLLLFCSEIVLIILLLTQKFEFMVQAILLVIIAMLLLPSLFFPLIEIANLSVIIKYYVVKEKHIELKNPQIYNFLKVVGIIISVSSIALMFVVGLIFDKIELTPIIGYFGFTIGFIIYEVAAYFRTLCFNESGKQKMIKCPYCNNDIPKKAFYCIYCDEKVTYEKDEKIAEIVDILGNNKTSL